MGVSIEALGYLRFKTMIDSKFMANDVQMDFMRKISITLNYLVSVSLTYALMLCVMSFNAGVFFATILGITIGYFFFSYLKVVKEKEMTYFMRDYTIPVMK